MSVVYSMEILSGKYCFILIVIGTSVSKVCIAFLLYLADDVSQAMNMQGQFVGNLICPLMENVHLLCVSALHCTEYSMNLNVEF